MAKKLKVYGWIGWRRKCPPAPNGSQQTREICAASSKAAVARLLGEKDPRQIYNLCETGNEEEIAKALPKPNVVFWHPLDERPVDRKWRKA
jgi:hypothetical protein